MTGAIYCHHWPSACLCRWQSDDRGADDWVNDGDLMFPPEGIALVRKTDDQPGLFPFRPLAVRSAEAPRLRPFCLSALVSR